MQISGSTEIYGIIGNPVAHSLSPIMHNSAFEALGLNKVMWLSRQPMRKKL